jgi:hypothetical protein
MIMKIKLGFSPRVQLGPLRKFASVQQLMYGEPMSTVAHVRGTIAGAAILTFFGEVWCILALAFWDARPRWCIPAGAVIAILLLAFSVQRFWALRNIPSVDDPIAAAKGKRAGMWFGIIFGAEGLLIWLCVMLLQHLDLSIWIPLAVAAIVGLHFLPLAHLFEAPIYYWTGALCVLGVLACCAIPDPGARAICAGMFMAAVLWTTALLLLLRPHPAQLQS